MFLLWQFQLEMLLLGDAVERNTFLRHFSCPLSCGFLRRSGPRVGTATVLEELVCGTCSSGFRSPRPLLLFLPLHGAESGLEIPTTLSVRVHDGDKALAYSFSRLGMD